MYPNESRSHMTTNKELFFKNFGKNFKAQSTAMNIFENQFKINQNRSMDLNTVYHNDFKYYH